MGRHTKDAGEQISKTAARFRELTNRWRAEDPAYDREEWPELKEALDRNRPEYRKLFPESSEDRPEFAES